MAKYTEKLVSRIERLIEADMYTISEICTAIKISRNTFYEWKEKNDDFCKRIARAEERRDEAMVKMARASLKKKIQGHTILEEKFYYEPAKSNSSVMILKKKVVRAIDKQPDLKAIKYMLDREDQKKERERQEKPKLQPNIIYVNNLKEADLYFQFEKKQRGTMGEYYRMATQQEWEEIREKEE